jgi:uncharacterized DUF497 family protein
MEFEWDEDKRLKVIAERRVDMLHAALMFEGPIVSRIDDRRDYGETRLIALGLVDDECFVVVYTKRGDTIRLITAWKGGRDERIQYEEGIARRLATDEGEG